MTIWCVRIACWIDKDADIHSEYAILIALPLQQWVHARVSMLRCTCIACLFNIILPSSPSSLNAFLSSSIRVTHSIHLTVLHIIAQIIPRMVHPCLSSDLCYFIPYNFLSTPPFSQTKYSPMRRSFLTYVKKGTPSPFCHIALCKLVPDYWRFGTCHSHLQGSRTPGSSWTAWPL
jgi:hypothetical protein